MRSLLKFLAYISAINGILLFQIGFRVGPERTSPGSNEWSS
jgi:hypothetical protein